MINAEMLEQFPLPEVAMENFRKQNYQSSKIDDGVDMFMAHDTGVSFRFFNHAEYNANKSKLVKYEAFDNITMIEWFVDKRNRVVEQVKFLPKELLSLDEDGVCDGGKYQETYERWLTGVNSPGMPISKWGVLSDAEAATLASVGVFSVEQLAAQPRGKMEGKYSLEIVQAFERAIQYVAGKAGRVDLDKHADEILKLSKESAKKDEAIAVLQEQMAQLLARDTDTDSAPKRSPGRPKKIVEE